MDDIAELITDADQSPAEPHPSEPSSEPASAATAAECRAVDTDQLTAWLDLAG